MITPINLDLFASNKFAIMPNNKEKELVYKLKVINRVHPYDKDTYEIV